MLKRSRYGALALLACLPWLLLACGGGGSSNTAPTQPANTYQVLVSVTDLLPNTQFVLQNNGGDNLTVTANGTYPFSNYVSNGSAYAVTVLTEPQYQICTITNGSGSSSNDNNVNVAASCNQPSVSIGGTVTDLAANDGIPMLATGNSASATWTLYNNSTNNPTNASPTFSYTFESSINQYSLSDGQTFTVTITGTTTVNGATCTFTSTGTNTFTGQVGGTDLTDMNITCS